MDFTNLPSFFFYIILKNVKDNLKKKLSTVGGWPKLLGAHGAVPMCPWVNPGINNY